jgi:alpha-tubulin suppressor-like RCC1 family protein
VVFGLLHLVRERTSPDRFRGIAKGEKFMFKIQSRGTAAWATALAAGLLLAGCGGGGTSDSPSPSPTPAPTTGSTGAAASLDISPASIDDFWGYSVQTQVTARDSAGAAISPRPVVTLTAGDASIASTDAATTTVNLLRPGQTTVTAAVGSVMATSTVNVRGFERLARVNQDTMCALADGRQRIYCWGSAGVTGTTMITSTPQQFQYVAPTPVPRGEIPAGTQISKVASDLFNMCALTDDGAVFCWGSGSTGSLGTGVAEGRSEPARIATGEVPAGVRFVDLGVSAYGGCAVGDDGRLYCWGYGNYIPNAAVSPNVRVLSPLATTQGDVAAGVKAVKVAVDVNGGCALGDNGRAYCWSSGARTPRLVTQGEVPINVRLVELQLGGGLPCALADNGQVYCWGTSFGRRFGAGNAAFSSSAPPTAVSTGAKPASARFTALTVGGIATSSCAVADNGKAYCWGRGYEGSAGDGVEADHEVLTPVEVLLGEKDAAFTWSAVNCSQLTCTGLASDRRIYSWGSNQNRMLSRESQTVRSATPLMVTRPTRP